MAIPFKLNGLDHVALRVRDLEVSAKWYGEILGLERFQPEEWKPWPVFIVSGSSGVAFFPEREGYERSIDHLAFRIDPEGLSRAQKWLMEKGIEFQYQDHVYFESVYFKDPDNHVVELTCEIGRK